MSLHLSTLCRLEDMLELIRNETSARQYCQATDMLRFLFSFCGADGNAAQVIPNDDQLGGAFSEVQELANEQDTPLRKYLKKM